MGYVLNVKDVLSDAHNTFIKSTEAKDCEQEMQMEDILKSDKAFNWSDEEMGGDDCITTTAGESLKKRGSDLENGRKSLHKRQTSKNRSEDK